MTRFQCFIFLKNLSDFWCREMNCAGIITPRHKRDYNVQQEAIIKVVKNPFVGQID